MKSVFTFLVLFTFCMGVALIMDFLFTYVPKHFNMTLFEGKYIILTLIVVALSIIFTVALRKK